MNAKPQMRQLRALSGSMNGLRPASWVVQRMTPHEIKTGLWYGIDGPRHIKTRRFARGGAPSWEFHTCSAGMRQGEAP